MKFDVTGGAELHMDDFPWPYIANHQMNETTQTNPIQANPIQANPTRGSSA